MAGWREDSGSNLTARLHLMRSEFIRSDKTVAVGVDRR
jgi:hypothetical protein